MIFRGLGMADVFSRSKRSWVMSKIRGVNTAPEKSVRSFLHTRGFRFRLHVKDLPGRPDIVLPSLQTVVFVHGCFWHHHPACKNAVYPRTRSHFWRAKINGNVQRDRKVTQILRGRGWRVIIVWECEVPKSRLLARRFSSLLAAKHAQQSPQS